MFQFLSATILLLVSTCFGFLGKPTEMGFAILAGVLGLAFSNLDKFSEFSGAGFSAKMKDQLQAVIDKETEESPTKLVIAEQLSSPEESVLKALADPKYTWRTLSGVSGETSCGESEVWSALVALIEKGLVRAANKNKTGEMVWSLTRKGRQKIV